MSLPAYASCRHLGLGECSSLTSEPSSLTVVAEYFFIHFPWVAGHAAAPEPFKQGGGVRWHGTRDGPLALRAGRRGPESLVAWQH
jgi:hypothetical protein